MADDIQTREPDWPWCMIQVEQAHYPALILRWEKHYSNHSGWVWSARVTYLNGNKHDTALIPAARVKRVG